jgi:predicted transcriptional regulator
MPELYEVMEDLVESIDVLSKRPAAEVLDDLTDAVREARSLSTDQLISLAFIAGLEVGSVGQFARTEYALRTENFRAAATGSLIDTGRHISDIEIKDLIAEAKNDSD